MVKIHYQLLQLYIFKLNYKNIAIKLPQKSPKVCFKKLQENYQKIKNKNDYL